MYQLCPLLRRVVAGPLLNPAAGCSRTVSHSSRRGKISTVDLYPWYPAGMTRSRPASHTSSWSRRPLRASAYPPRAQIASAGASRAPALVLCRHGVHLAAHPRLRSRRVSTASRQKNTEYSAPTRTRRCCHGVVAAGARQLHPDARRRCCARARLWPPGISTCAKRSATARCAPFPQSVPSTLPHFTTDATRRHPSSVLLQDHLPAVHAVPASSALTCRLRDGAPHRSAARRPV